MVEDEEDTGDFREIFLVMDLMDSDLQKVIANREEKLDDAHIQWLVYQLLCALNYMHSAGIFHRDLKPANILVSADCELRVADLGLGRGVGGDGFEEADNALTQYVVTRWYRAPELLLLAEKYDGAIDVWAAGLIFAELM